MIALFQSEAKFEEEREQLQRQLMSEQQELLCKYRNRENRIHEIDSQQTQMVSSARHDMHTLESRRQAMVEEFRKVSNGRGVPKGRQAIVEEFRKVGS